VQGKDGGEVKAIGLDLDGVLVAWPDYVLSVINKRLGTDYKITDWKDYYGVSSFVPEAQPIIREMVSDPVSYLLARPLKGAVRAVRTLGEFADIYFITCRPAHCEAATEAWLAANHLWLGELIVTQGSKADIVKDMDLLAFVDDRAEFARDVAPYVQHSILFDTSWNQGEHEGLVRLKGWMNTMEYLLRKVM
jgi:5'(3')-deoxyribonucleotidase